MFHRKYFELAIQAARKGPHPRDYWIGAVGIRKDGTIVSAHNGLSTIHGDLIIKCAHAEQRLARKLDKGAVVYVARTRVNGDIAPIEPCKNCRRILRSKGIRYVHCLMSENSWKTWDLRSKE
jgi:hypothetical protein